MKIPYSALIGAVCSSMSALGLSLCFVNSASAQTVARPRGFVNVNGGYQLTANDFSNGAVKRENAEDGRLDAKYVVKAGPTIDISGGARIWRSIVVGVGITRFSMATPTSLTATIPHPFFFNQNRSVSGEAVGLKREELTVHIQARVVLPVARRFEASVFGGPSFFQVRQGVATDLTYTESYPYDEAKFATATTTTPTVSKLGFNVGGDFAYFFARQVGVGGSAQFAATKIELPGAVGTNQTVNVGGTTVGVGLRLRF